MEKAYIGDSVYVEYDGYYIILTTRNGLPEDPSNIILLEPCVYENLLQFVLDNTTVQEEPCKSTDA